MYFDVEIVLEVNNNLQVQRTFCLGEDVLLCKDVAF